MTWEIFYSTCFLIGFLWTLVSALSGSLHLHWHLPAKCAIPDSHHAGSLLAPFNFSTIAAFLAWFGGTGYLLTRYSNVWALLGLGIAVMSGVGGAALIFWFLMSVLMSKEENLNPADYEMIGVLANVTSTIREDGTGELVYSRAGTRRVANARSETGRAIPKGAEVVVTRYEKGIAYVRCWEDLTNPTPARQ